MVLDMVKLTRLPDFTTLSHPETDVLIVSLHAQIEARSAGKSVAKTAAIPMFHRRQMA